MGLVFLITFSNLLAKLLLPTPMTLGCVCLKVLLIVPYEGMLPSGDTMIPFTWKMRLPPCHIELLTPLN